MKTRTSIVTDEVIKQAKLFPYPDPEGHERCGVVLLARGLKMLRNTHEQPDKHYRMVLRSYLSPEKVSSFLGVFHTHIRMEEDEPSWHDLKQLRLLRKRVPRALGIVLNVPLGLLVEYDGEGPVSRVLINQ